MLSSATTDRVSRAYTRGYQDGAAGRAPAVLHMHGVWARTDYPMGWRAGCNDRLWDYYYAGIVLASWIDNSTKEI